MQYLQDFKKTLELREQLLTYIKLRAQKYTCYGEAVDPSSIDRYMNYENSFLRTQLMQLSRDTFRLLNITTCISYNFPVYFRAFKFPLNA